MVGYLLSRGVLTGATPKGIGRLEGWPVKLTWCSPGTAIGYPRDPVLDLNTINI